jgi:hypothetical protein
MPVADKDYKQRLRRKQDLVDKRSGVVKPKYNPRASEGPSVNRSVSQPSRPAPLFRDRTRIMPSASGGLINLNDEEDNFIANLGARFAVSAGKAFDDGAAPNSLLTKFGWNDIPGFFLPKLDKEADEMSADEKAEVTLDTLENTPVLGDAIGLGRLTGGVQENPTSVKAWGALLGLGIASVANPLGGQKTNKKIGKKIIDVVDGEGAEAVADTTLTPIGKVKSEADSLVKKQEDRARTQPNNPTVKSNLNSAREWQTLVDSADAEFKNTPVLPDPLKGGTKVSLKKSNIQTVNSVIEYVASPNNIGNDTIYELSGLSDVAVRMISLGLPLDSATLKKVIAAGSAEELSMLGIPNGTTRVPSLKGDRVVQIGGITQSRLTGRIRSLQAGATKRMQPPGDSEDFTTLNATVDPDTGYPVNYDDIPNEALVDVPESVTAAEALSGRPTQLAAEWIPFIKENPRIPFYIRDVRGGHVRGIGPAGEHPFSASNAGKIGEERGWTDSPEINKKMFWLSTPINFKKSGFKPHNKAEEIRAKLPTIGSIILPEGGYTESKWNEAIEDTARLFPDWEEFIRTNPTTEEWLSEISKRKKIFNFGE